MEKKKCSKCHIKKSVSKFYMDIQKIDGLTSSCIKCCNQMRKEYYEKNRDKCQKYQKFYYITDKKHKLQKAKFVRRRVFLEIFKLLGNKCKRCGMKDKRVLQIDHLEGGGYKHRKRNRSGIGYYREILKQIKDKSGKYQILCSNCNYIEGIEKGYRGSLWT